MSIILCLASRVGAHQGARLPSAPGGARGAPPRSPRCHGRLRRRGAERVQQVVRFHLIARSGAHPRCVGLEEGGRRRRRARQEEHHVGTFIPRSLSLQCEG